MKFLRHCFQIRHVMLMAFLLAGLTTVSFPLTASAHADLVRSDPAANAVVQTAPTHIRMWFSEDLNSSFSTATVSTSAGTRVAKQDAHVLPHNPLEMDITLASQLSSGLYQVFYRSVAADDGHVLTGSFSFTVVLPGGTIPKASNMLVPKQNPLVTTQSTPVTSGLLDTTAWFNLIMFVLVELAAIVWVGAQIWHTFVLPKSGETQSTLIQRIYTHFQRYWSLPLLLVLVGANLGILVGQGLKITGNVWATALAPSFLWEMATSSRYGTFWLLREIVTCAALLMSGVLLLAKSRARSLERPLSWVNLGLGLLLLFAISMSSHAASVAANMISLAVLADFFHLLAASLWVGGMLYIATTYLPVLKQLPGEQQARSLVKTLPLYSPWAVAGVLLMAITGPFNATFHLHSWDQLLTTTYGNMLSIKVMMIGGMLVISAIHVFLLRPRLAKEVGKYDQVMQRLHTEQDITYTHGTVGFPSVTQQPPRELHNQALYDHENASFPTAHVDLLAIEKAQDRSMQTPSGVDKVVSALLRQMQLRKMRLAKQTQRLHVILSIEPLLGIIVILCTGLMNLSVTTLAPAPVPTPQVAPVQQPAGTASQPIEIAMKTTDGVISMQLTVTPSRSGSTVLMMRVVNVKTRRPMTNLGITISMTMLTMHMGTSAMTLHPSQGRFQGTTDTMNMAGTWQLSIQMRTQDHKVHKATAKLVIPSF